MDKLYYNSPAYNWKSALPLGNGITGIMISGGRKKDRLWLNDTTLWSGYPKDQDNPESLKHIGKVRELIFAGRNKEAQNLAEQYLTGGYSESYLPLGQMTISLTGMGGNYSRELDIKRAIHTIKTDSAVRTAFISYPDKVAVYRIENTEKFNVKISLFSQMSYTASSNGGGLEMSGEAPDYVVPNYLRTEKKPIRYNEGRGMCWAVRAEVVTDGNVSYSGTKMAVNGAKTLTIYMVTATGFKAYNEMPATDSSYALDKCRSALKALEKNYDGILKRHIEDYSALYNKQSVNLNEESELPTDKLLKKTKKSGKASLALINLLYNYGKYLTIAGSRKGGQALNLQGLWNKSMRPPWSSNYTVNINTEMNYWGASQAGLNECLSPFVDLVYGIMERGRKTAEVNYGARGYACNHNVDIWRKTAPVQGDSNYMYEPLCGVWLINELVEHMNYGGIDEYKKEIIEIMEDAARFVNDYLVLHEGFFVTCPSASPETVFNKDNTKCALDYASAFEMGLIKQLFANCLKFSRDKELIKEIAEKEKQLYPFTEGEIGINEWHDYVSAEKGHRHFSPLYSFYPACVIGYYGDTEKREWIRKLFHYRQAHSLQAIGWSAAWAISLAARLREPKRVKLVIDSMLSHSVFKNLFGVHPPFLFQIDGNLGFVAGINEMLVTCEDGVIELLPGCPEEFHSGEVKNMRIVTGHGVSFKWKDGKVIEISIQGEGARLRDVNLDSKLELKNIKLIK